MKKLVLLSLLVLGGTSLRAQENKPHVKLGGQFYLAAYYDSYKSVERRDGVDYSYPMAPNLDPDGKDLNKAGQFGMSVYQTRLNVSADGFRVLNADARVYVEMDFLGASNEFLQMIRLRHAYLDLHWAKDELLLGQSNNIEYPAEVVSGLLTSGAGSPIAILSRPIMVRYGRDLGGDWKIYAALSYHKVQAGHTGDPQTMAANRHAALPSAEARIQYGSVDKVFFGLSGGYKMLRPRLETANGYRASETIGSASMTAFLRWNCAGHTFKTQGAYGSNMTHLGMIGGYGKRAGDEGEDYAYTNLKTMSVWADFETKPCRHFQFGLFGGYMENLGSVKEIDPSVVYSRNANLYYTGRVSPRVTWTKDKMLFGVEYSCFWSKWGQTFDEHFQPAESFGTTRNNRVLFLARYTF